MSNYEQISPLKQKTVEERVFDLECQVSLLSESLDEILKVNTESYEEDLQEIYKIVKKSLKR